MKAEDCIGEVRWDCFAEDNLLSRAWKEIIEFSCVVIDASTLDILTETFQQHVKPTVNPKLTPFCIELTGIQQEQVDGAKGLREVLYLHDRWLKEQHMLDEDVSFIPVTWTDWDLEVQLQRECEWRGIKKPAYFNQWINLKKIFGRLYKKTASLEKCMAIACVELEGRKHCGLDDASNTARLAIKMIHDGAVMKITGRFYSADSHTSEKSKGSGATAKKQKSILDWVSTSDGKNSNKRKHPDEESSGGSGKKSGGKKSEGKKSEIPKKCECGVSVKLREVKRPGANLGRKFWSCGKWTITRGKQCNFFAWVEEQANEKKAKK